MKRKVISSLILFFCCFYSIGQFKIYGDRDFKNYSDSLLKYIGLRETYFSKYDFEMRFWVTKIAGDDHALFSFKHLKNGTWTLNSYYFSTSDWSRFDKLQTDSLQLQERWIGKWDSLKNNHILTLPTEMAVFKKWKSSTGNIIVVADGVNYRIELFTSKKRRRYS